MDSKIMNPAQKSIGPTVGLIIIMLIIIAGGIYFWFSRSKNNLPTPANQENAAGQQGSATDPSNPQAIRQQNSSDSLDSIQADLNSYNSTGINNADASLQK